MTGQGGFRRRSLWFCAVLIHFEEVVAADQMDRECTSGCTAFEPDTVWGDQRVRLDGPCARFNRCREFDDAVSLARSIQDVVTTVASVEPSSSVDTQNRQLTDDARDVSRRV